MTNEDQEIESGTVKFWKRGGIAGVGLGFLAIILCELPIILAVVGIGGFGATALALRPPFLVEVLALVLLVVGLSVLIFIAYRKRRRRGV